MPPRWGGGAVCQGVRTGSVILNGAKTAHKLPRTSSRIICCEKFHKELIMCPREAPNGQHNCCCIRESIGSVQFSSGFVGMGPKEQNNAQCRALCGSPQYSSRLRVSSFPGFQQLALGPVGLQGSHADSGPMLNRPICRQVEQPASSIVQLETRPSYTSDRRSPTGLVPRPELCLPAILPDHAFSSQTTGGWRGVGLNHTSMANTTLVSQVTGYVNIFTNPSSVSPQYITKPSGREQPLLENQTLSLAVWHVSNNLCNRRAFVQMLPNSFWQRGGQAQMQFITPPGKNGIAGVSAWKLIHFATLWQI